MAIFKKEFLEKVIPVIESLPEDTNIISIFPSKDFIEINIELGLSKPVEKIKITGTVSRGPG